MALTKKEKQKIIEDLVEKIQKQKIMIFFDFTGLKVQDLNKLRKEMKLNGSEIKVAKKTFLNIALKKTGLSNKLNVKELIGELAVVFGFKDEISPTKICYQFSKDNQKLKILTGIFKGDLLDKEKVFELAQLPSKEELFSVFTRNISAPISNLIYSLRYNIKGLIHILSIIKK